MFFERLVPIFCCLFHTLFDKFYYLCTANQITIINFKPITIVR